MKSSRGYQLPYFVSTEARSFAKFTISSRTEISMRLLLIFPYEVSINGVTPTGGISHVAHVILTHSDRFNPERPYPVPTPRPFISVL